MAIAAILFVVILAVVLGSYWLVIVRPEHQSEREVRARLKPRRTPKLVAASVVKARERFSAVRALDTTLTQWGNITKPVGDLIAQSGLKTTVGTVVLSCVFVGVLAATAVGQVVPYVAIAIVAGIAIGSLPILYLKRKASNRLAVFEEQFPEAIDLIARALRAGHALPTALQMVSEEIDDPIGAEFRLLFDQQNFGMSLPDALKAFALRIPLVDARFFVTALLTQREMGGNLSEVLDKLASVIRDRFKVKRQVRAVSAHGRITGFVLGFLPPSVALILFALSPEHLRLLVEDPLGVNMIIVAVVLQVVGVLIIRRIVEVEY